MNVWALSLASITLVSLVSLVGLLTLSLDVERVRRLSLSFVSFAVGALLGDAFIHLIPEAFSRTPASTLKPSLLILGGLLAFFGIEKILRRRHAALNRHAEAVRPRIPELATLNVIGDGVHNFIDGVLVGASYLVSPALGISTTVAVLLHEIPQELGDFGILIHSGLSVRKAILLNLGSASIAILGTLTTLIVGSGAREAVTAALVPITAGGFVYIALADLVPELRADRSVRGLLGQGGLIIAGMLTMAVLKIVE